MKLLRATFLSIRGLPDTTIDLGDPRSGAAHDVVAITGDPGSGKTRVLEAILAAKEVIAPYGQLRDGGSWVARGATAAKIELSFGLDEGEQRYAGAREPVIHAEALFEPRLCRGEADDGLIALLERYEHRQEYGKLEYFPANRGVVAPGAMRGLSAIEQRLLRTTRDERKYDFIPRLVLALATDGLFAPCRARFEAAITSLCPTLRYLPPSGGDALACFSSHGGAPVHPTELSSTEADAVVFASTAALLDFERSILFIDRPEISVDERAIARWVGAVRALATDVQLIVATSSPALLASMDSRAIVTLRASR